jgi:hypothetical protein
LSLPLSESWYFFSFSDSCFQFFEILFFIHKTAHVLEVSHSYHSIAQSFIDAHQDTKSGITTFIVGN